MLSMQHGYSSMLFSLAVYNNIRQRSRIKLMKKSAKIRNPVAKYLRKYNKGVVMADRKKAVKSGYVKHKETTYE